MKKLNTLTVEEERVILHKGTEAPGTEAYETRIRDGLYLCRRCNTPLYDSRDKFEAHCGWPSFDNELPGTVKKSLDRDGYRTEITCAECGAHLGHVFVGEKFTKQDIRHCVNSLSMRFIPRDFLSGEKPFFVLGGGCFWCLEAAYQKMQGVLESVSGYAGGDIENSTYSRVSTGKTGHAEVVRILYDPQKITSADILTVFFAIHDPTTRDRQGNDIGSQYRSVIFYATWKQKQEAEKIVEKFEKESIFKNPIVTEIVPLIRFFPAETYHQNYYAKNPEKAYCQVIISPKLKKLHAKFSKLLS